MNASESDRTTVTRAGLSDGAEVAGYAALMPFVLGLLALALLPSWALRDLAQRLLVAYGGSVLAFFGAVHWGLALAGHKGWSPALIAWAIAPMVAATAAIAIGGQRALALLLVGFGIFWLYEHRHCAPWLPPRWLALRRNFTLAACVLLAIAAFVSEALGLR